MNLTRTDIKIDTAIARLLLQNPMGLTIGDITAEAKCTPQTARKSLARIGAEKDASGMLYVLRDDDAQQPEQDAHAEPEAEQATEPTKPTQQPETVRANWGGIPFLNPFADAHAPEPTDPEPTDPAPAAVAEAPAAQPELTPFQIASEQYKPGDKIMILAAADWCQPSKRALVGKVQTVAVVESFDGEPFILTNSDEKNAHFWAWCWKLDEVRHATAEEIAAASTPEPDSAAEVPLSDLQQRILSLLGQHRGLTAQRIAEDLHEPLDGVQDALHDLSHLIASRPLALPEIKVWEVVA